MKKLFKRIFNIKNFIMLILVLVFISSSAIILQYILESYNNSKLNNIKKQEMLLSNNTYISEEEKYKEKLNLRKNQMLELYKDNNDIIGWIYIENSNIDYPILQGTDNEYYISHNFKKEKSKYGSITVDYRNKIDDENLIIYGHHMKDKQMFGDLIKFKDKEFFEINNIIIITKEGVFQYKPFSVYITDTSHDYLKNTFNNEEEYNDYLYDIIGRSYNVSEDSIDVSNKIITLSTCSYETDDSRFVVHGVLENIIEN